MPKENYMALADFQDLWTNRIKPSITSTYATKGELPESATVDTCMDIIKELV